MCLEFAAHTVLTGPVMLINDSDELEKPMHKKLEGKPMYEEKRQEAME